MPRVPIRLPVIAGVLCAMMGLAGADAAMPAATEQAGHAGPLRVAADARDMPPQMRLATVRGIQMELLAHGYRPGPPDGALGARTRAAIQRYQHDAGLPVDGIASRELLDHLSFVVPKINTFGDPAPGVVLDVQRELAKRWYYLGPHDGVAGPAMLRAVQRFRADARLPPGGPIDSRFLQEIRDAPAEVSVEPRP